MASAGFLVDLNQRRRTQLSVGFGSTAVLTAPNRHVRPRNLKPQQRDLTPLRLLGIYAGRLRLQRLYACSYDAILPQVKKAGNPSHFGGRPEISFYPPLKPCQISFSSIFRPQRRRSAIHSASDKLRRRVRRRSKVRPRKARVGQAPSLQRIAPDPCCARD
jgi:hypothetical protein